MMRDQVCDEGKTASGTGMRNGPVYFRLLTVVIVRQIGYENKEYACFKL